MLLDELKARLRRSEGREHRVYTCPAGHPTIGVGFNLDRADAAHRLASVGAVLEDVLAGEPLTDQQIDELLDVTAREAIAEASALAVGWSSLPSAMQAVLADLAFNMGARKLRGFVLFLAAVRNHNWSRAADELVDSAWYHQVGDRSRRIIAEVRSLGEA